jgi:hypothetical protein
MWFQANSRLGTIGYKQTQTAKALLQAMPTQTFGFKQTQCMVPLDLSNPYNKSPFTNHFNRNIGFKQTRTGYHSLEANPDSKTLGSKQTMPTEHTWFQTGYHSL